ncbi:MAG: aminotransferase class IV [Flavobacteriaceae bacterium]
MINFNGKLQDHNRELTANRGFKFGDAVFETIKVVNGKILFLEDHYFRLMASMRVIRMEIPMSYTMEFWSAEILKYIDALGLASASARVRLTVYRTAEGLYAPNHHEVAFVMEAHKLDDEQYVLNTTSYEVDLFKDHYITPQLLSTLKTNNRVLNVIASIYAKENDLANCLLLNSNKQVVEAINGNVFVVKGKQIKTPPLADGCVKGIMRMQLIKVLSTIDGYEVVEASISPFELQKADEIFITNVIQGVVPVTKYRKKEYVSTVAQQAISMLNDIIA